MGLILLCLHTLKDVEGNAVIPRINEKVRKKSVNVSVCVVDCLYSCQSCDELVICLGCTLILTQYHLE